MLLTINQAPTDKDLNTLIRFLGDTDDYIGSIRYVVNDQPGLNRLKT